MATYENITGVTLQMLGLNVPAGETVETKYYPQDESTVMHGTKIKTFTDAITADWIEKISDEPNFSYTLTSEDDNTGWIKMNNDFEFATDGNSTVELQYSPDKGNTIYAEGSYSNESVNTITVSGVSWFKATVTSYTSDTTVTMKPK